MTSISIGGVAKALAATKNIPLAIAKNEVIEACAAGLIEAWWRGDMINGRPTLIARQKWMGADVDLGSGVVILASGKRMAQVYADALVVDAWVKEQTRKSNVIPLSRDRGTPKARARHKRDRAREAIKALWSDGPPDQASLSNDLFCEQVIGWIKADCKAKGISASAEPGRDTILRARTEVGSI